MQRSGRAPYLLLLAICVLFFWRFVFLQEIPIDAGPLHQMRPWSHGKPDLNADSARTYHNIDPVVEVLPIKKWMVDRLREGDVPLWTPVIFSGAPFAANHHAAPWDFSTPFFLLFAPDIAFGFTLMIQLFAAGASAFFLCRVLQYSVRSSLIGASAFLFNSFFFHWLGLISFNAGLIWMPLIPAGIELGLRHNSIRRMWPSAVGLGFTFLSGMGQFWLFQVFLFIAYGGYRFLTLRPGVRSAGALVLTLLFGCGMGTAQILQTAGVLPYTSRGGKASRAAVYEGRNHLSPRRLPTLLIPDLYGRQEENIFSKLLLKAGYPEARGFSGRLLFGEKGSVFNRAWGYVGIPALLLAIAGFFTVRRPASFFRWLAAGVLGFQILLCWESFHNLCAWLWPGFDTLDHTRTIILYVLGVSVLAAEGMDRMSANSARMLFRASTAIAILLALVAAASFFAPAMTDIPGRILKGAAPNEMYALEFFKDAGPKIEQGFRDSAGILVLPILVLVLFALIVRFHGEGRIDASKTALLLLILSVADLAWHGWNDPPLTYASRESVSPPPGEVLRFLQQDPDLFRVYEVHRKLPLPELPLQNYSDLQRIRRSTIRFFDLESVEFVLRPDTLIPYGIQSAGGYMSLYPGRYKQLWQGRGMDVLKALKSSSDLEQWNAPWIGMQNIKYVLAPEEYSVPGWKPVLTSEGIQVLRVDSFAPRIFAVPRARVIPDENLLASELRSPTFDPLREVLLESTTQLALHGEEVQYSITDVQQSSDHLSFSAELSTDAYVVLSVNYFPWWRAFADGREITLKPANLSMQCLQLARGKHQIHMEFQPPYYKISLLVSLASACCLFLAGASLGLHAKEDTDRSSAVL